MFSSLCNKSPISIVNLLNLNVIFLFIYFFFSSVPDILPHEMWNKGKSLLIILLFDFQLHGSGFHPHVASQSSCRDAEASLKKEIPVNDSIVIIYNYDNNPDH